MTMQTPPEFLYLAEEDLFRMGNAMSPRLDHVREEIDVDTFERNGIKFILANGKGISLLTESRVAQQKGGWLWKLPANTPLPAGLGLNNDRPGHYALCPLTDMSIDRYRALLSELAVKCERIEKK